MATVTDQPQKTEVRTISAATRRDIIDYLTANKVDWSGRLEEIDFLSRVWDLKSLPSMDSRFEDAEKDIWQHCVNNPGDWPDDWVLRDSRFLPAGSDKVFVDFLAQMLHPIVRDEAEVRELLSVFNECLSKDGWELVQVGRLSGRPMFEGRRRGTMKKPSESLNLVDHPRLADPEGIAQHLNRIDRDVNSDPAAAIGASKDLVESIFKSILDDYGESYAGADDLLTLYKKVQKVLRLRKESVPGHEEGSEAVNKLLRTLASTVQSVAEVRNKIGTGHGRAKRSPALTRHAQLASTAATGIANFLLDTWHERFELIQKLESAQQFDDARKYLAELDRFLPLSDPELVTLVRVANSNFQIYGAHEYSPEAVGGRLWEVVKGREKAIPPADMKNFRENFEMPVQGEDIPF